MSYKELIKFCSKCGGEGKYLIPKDDNRRRFKCSVCGEIAYENPKLVVGILPYIDTRILLCQRTIDPGNGLWTIPSGFFELNETVSEGALREASEEANVQVKSSSLFLVKTLPKVGQVYMIFSGELASETSFSPGVETSDCQLVSRSDLDQYPLAFSSVQRAVSLYFDSFDPSVPWIPVVE